MKATKIFREIGRLLRPHKRKAEADWRNNPPILQLNDHDKAKALIMQKFMEQWWKENHKKVGKKLNNRLLNQ